MSIIVVGALDLSLFRREFCLNYGVFFLSLKFIFRKFRWGKFNVIFEKLGFLYDFFFCIKFVCEEEGKKVKNWRLCFSSRRGVVNFVMVCWRMYGLLLK